MERNIPKNVRQIGNVSDPLKIYVEDYVDTYLNQLCERDAEEPMGALLLGVTAQEGSLKYRYIYGAIAIEGMRQEEEGVVIPEESWEESKKLAGDFFADGEVIGWCAALPGAPLVVDDHLKKIHYKLFSEQTGVFVMKDPVTRDEAYFAPKFNDLMQMNGHYIYYEKNPSMQNYMISTRKKIGVTPSEVVADRAAKNFRDLVQTKMVRQEKRPIKIPDRLLYGAGTLLIIVLLMTGISVITNYDRMKSVRMAIEAVSEAEESENITVDIVDNPDAYNNGFYIVEEGDTLAGISKKAYGDFEHIDAISRLNNLENGNLIYIGQKLLLP